MISLALTISLSLLSFMTSAFILIRIVVPILPPTPFSRRVPPSEFGLPNYRSLSTADKSHLWLACLDLLALGFFVWQAVTTGLLVSTDISYDPLSAARLWIALTLRQTCLLFVTSLALIYVKLGRPVSLGPIHCLLWAPILICTLTGSGIGTVLAKVGLGTIWGGLAIYSIVVALLTTACFACLVGTLLLIRNNVSAAVLAETEEEWPPLKKSLRRRSIVADDIEALKEGSSWITSHRSSSSSRNSISAFSFSTAHQSQQGTTAPVTGSAPSVLPKSSYWFGTATLNSAALISQDSIPPVPPVPSPYRERNTSPPANQVYDQIPDDPFHRSPPRPSKSSANSWLTSPSVSQVTLSEFSFPTTRPGSPDEHEQLNHTAPTPTVHEKYECYSQSHAITTTQPLSESRVLGGYGRQDGLVGLSPKAKKDVDISILRCAAWMVFIWLPVGFSLPYLSAASRVHDFRSPLACILLTLSVVLSSPFLALNLLLRFPLPIPTSLFSPLYSPSNPSNILPSLTEVRIHPEMRGRSTSMTVVEGRRSGDVWIAKGEAVDGRGKAARVLGLLAPTPRLAVLPLSNNEKDAELTPPLPIRDGSLQSIALSSPSVNGAEVGEARTRKDSKASSYWSGVDESLAYNSRIMIAHRHYSSMATTVFIPPSSKPVSGTARNSRHSSVGKALDDGVATGVQHTMTKGHHRSASASSLLQTPRSSMQNRFPLTPPPASPLPPTPPNMRHLQHSRSHSSSGSGFSFRPIASTNQIDSLSAGLLPLLVPGLKVGNDMVIKDSSSPPNSRRRDVFSKTPPKDSEFGFSSSASFNSPEIHSTPARHRNKSGQKWKKHLSLPSLGLGKDGVHSLSAWKEDLVRVLDGLDTKTPRNRNTIHDTEPPVPTVTVQYASSGTLNPVTEEEPVQFGYAITSESSQSNGLGLSPPTSASVYSDGFNTARSSMATMMDMPPTSATALIHPAIHDQNDQPPKTARSSYPNTETAYGSNAFHLPNPPVRKFSLVYIKSDDTPGGNNAQDQTQNVRSAARASVKRHIPSNLKPLSSVEKGSPLRKLTLLSNRDQNADSSSPNTRPLAITKKGRAGDKENNGLRPLKLARSATAKARGLLRQNEVLPEVVVRPPSSSLHTGFAYTFR